MQVLVDWLGPEVAASFDSHARVLLSGRPAPLSNQLFTALQEVNQQTPENDATASEVLAVLNRLNDQERQAVYEIAQLLVARHSNAAQGNGHLPERAPNTDEALDVAPQA
jgi:hypothetical protein